MTDSHTSRFDRASESKPWRVVAITILVAIAVLNGALPFVLPAEHDTGRDVILIVLGSADLVGLVLLIRLWRGAVLRRGHQ